MTEVNLVAEIPGEIVAVEIGVDHEVVDDHGVAVGDDLKSVTVDPSVVTEVMRECAVTPVMGVLSETVTSYVIPVTVQDEDRSAMKVIKVEKFELHDHEEKGGVAVEDDAC